MKVSYALVGCGVMGRQHAWHAATYDAASEIILYVDAVPERAQHLAAAYGGHATAEYARALDDPRVQGVILAVPDVLHAPLALDESSAAHHRPGPSRRSGPGAC